MSEIISFKNYCTCGGYAHQINGRDKNNPHMSWCPQKQEYDKYIAENKNNGKLIVNIPKPRWNNEIGAYIHFHGEVINAIEESGFSYKVKEND